MPSRSRWRELASARSRAARCDRDKVAVTIGQLRPLSLADVGVTRADLADPSLVVSRLDEQATTLPSNQAMRYAMAGLRSAALRQDDGRAADIDRLVSVAETACAHGDTAAESALVTMTERQLGSDPDIARALRHISETLGDTRQEESTMATENPFVARHDRRTHVSHDGSPTDALRQMPLDTYAVMVAQPAARQGDEWYADHPEHVDVIARDLYRHGQLREALDGTTHDKAETGIATTMDWYGLRLGQGHDVSQLVERNDRGSWQASDETVGHLAAAIDDQGRRLLGYDDMGDRMLGQLAVMLERDGSRRSLDGARATYQQDVAGRTVGNEHPLDTPRMCYERTTGQQRIPGVDVPARRQADAPDVSNPSEKMDDYELPW